MNLFRRSARGERTHLPFDMFDVEYPDAEARRALGMELDVNNTMFQAMHESRGDLKYDEAGGVFRNVASNSVPVLLHYNGGAKKDQVVMDVDLVAAEARRNGGLARTPDGREMGAVVVPGLDFTVRELCCSNSWTDNNAYNKLRPKWLSC